MIIIHQRAGVFGPGPTRGRWARGSSTSPGAVPKFGRGTTAAEGPNERSKEVVVSGARGGGGLGTLTCGSVLCLTLVRRLQDKPTHGQKYTHNRMRKKKQGPVGEAPRPPPWTAKGTEPHPVPQRNADVGRPSRPQAGPAVIHAPQPTPHKRSAPGSLRLRTCLKQTGAKLSKRSLGA